MKPQCVTIQMKAIEQYMYFQVVLFIMLNKVVVLLSLWIKPLVCDHSNESYWAVLDVVLFIMLYKVILTFEFVDKTLVCDHSNESYWAALSCGT